MQGNNATKTQRGWATGCEREWKDFEGTGSPILKRDQRINLYSCSKGGMGTGQ